ncbi:GNAT family N-acetyltransferase [Nocardia lijiangensis]|uniref:GNAT family N-acetyltransferase n=1 Tax=Nocardia lijiangensis TaxID=299618 RepID=UPI0012DD3A13|nr:GNAT family N-acetyltransferase [Nocardia lijiangensis]
MNPPEIRWDTITERREVKSHPFQAFSCTEPHPETPQGRRLPHPKPWEWAAQRLIRQSSRCFQSGSLLVVGWSRASNEILAVAHLIPEVSAAGFSVHIGVVGVSTAVRGQGGTVADQTLEEVRNVILEDARASSVSAVLATANIDTQNFASQRLFERAGYEPRSVPSGDLQQWIRRLDS